MRKPASVSFHQLNHQLLAANCPPCYLKASRAATPVRHDTPCNPGQSSQGLTCFDADCVLVGTLVDVISERASERTSVHYIALLSINVSKTSRPLRATASAKHGLGPVCASRLILYCHLFFVTHPDYPTGNFPVAVACLAFPKPNRRMQSII